MVTSAEVRHNLRKILIINAECKCLLDFVSLVQKT